MRFKKFSSLLFPVLLMMCLTLFTLFLLQKDGLVSASIVNASEDTVQNAVEDIPTEVISIRPADYGITEDMLNGAESVDVSKLSLEALGAYFLHTDGAMAEGSGEELYQRFIQNPSAVLYYLTQLGEQMARGNHTAATELCQEIAFADVFWYDATPVFSATLDKLQESDNSPQVLHLLQCLEQKYQEACHLASGKFFIENFKEMEKY